MTAIIPPVLSKKADKDPLCWLEFTPESIVTSSKTGEFMVPGRSLSGDVGLLTTMVRIGHVRTWNRPLDNSTQAENVAS